jgi:hypothetical protein
MPVVGHGGALELRRELPEPVLFSPEAVAAHVSAVDVGSEGFWTGDKVWVWGARGLPLDLNGDGEPDITSGWGVFYGSRYRLHPTRRARLTSGAAKWFGTEPPFQNAASPGTVDRLELYVYRDSLDRLSFYRTFNEALGGESADRLTFYPVDFRCMLLAPAGSTGYQQRLEPTYPELEGYRLPADRSAIPLSQASNAALPEPTGEDDDRPWVFAAEMESWTLELDASEVETTGIGERYGESTRAMVTGGGTLNFFVNRNQNADEADAIYLAQLLIVLEQGSSAEAIFRVTRKHPYASTAPGSRRLPTNNVSYKAKLLLTNTATDTTADDVIRGSARFITVGRIRLDIS